ncbi:peptidoglycan-binding protein [Streptomyces pakalii]|uniref:Peptidoglycan-binding protein n=1 Tax=Streptomyces pakalii TaxID=3036494 RepID=A0ABT7DHH3_9ACTN|nr:peptidoglycan-binding protein [Streptomyces pakalii]MDJ1645285.1 peptidoglycan-binding protein [Streptomyces pakalii]
MEELRRLKDSRSLSLTGLARRTTFSRSSWDRYLNGASFPPEAAVRELAALCHTDPDVLLALRALAQDHPSAGVTARPKAGTPPSQSDADASVAEPVTDMSAPATAATEHVAQRSRLPLRAWRSRAVPAAAAAVSGLIVMVAFTGDDGSGTDRSRQIAAAAFVYKPGRTHTCDIHRHEGLLHAGHSDTREAILQQISTSWDVVEAQCLLKHHGYSPGLVDGAYGQSTEKAVKRLQDAAGIVPDGIVGSHTWAVMRR